MKAIRRLSLAVAVATCAVGANAADLAQVYRDAVAHDAEFAAARSALDAGREKLPQGRAQLLPSLTLSNGLTHTELDVQHDDNVMPLDQRDYRTNTFSLALSQPLLRIQNSLQYRQSDRVVRQAEASYGQARQDIILRVAQAYFDVLAAQDSLALVEAQKTAIEEQLAQAKVNFESGTATITDTHEAQARFDLIVAEEVAARSDLDIRRRALQSLTGQQYDQLNPLPRELTLTAPDEGIGYWVELAQTQSLPVIIRYAQTEIQQLEVKRHRASRLPTVDLVASYGNTDQTGSQLSSVGNRIETGVVGIQINASLFAGGGVSSKIRESAALLSQAQSDLDAVRDQQGLAAEQTYLSVVNGIAQVKALEQARASSESALDSNRTGYAVGVRINVDVLNAQQQLYSTERDLAHARYRAILDGLKLKATAGALNESDIQRINALMSPRQ